ncbi:MAG: divalent cation tolerance protein CutA [Ottowia sp.]|nr:divalent-cation tolerance protein CutA [Ottowia sp.]
MATTRLPWLVTTTVATREQADTLARAMVGWHLTACAQIEAISSVYRWRDELHEEAEYRITFKTVPERFAQLKAALLAAHPYEQPTVEAQVMQAVDETTAKWIAENSSGSPG